MRKLGLALGLIALSFLVACGGGSSTAPGIGGPTPQGSFSNASLSGQYTYQFRGFDYSVNPLVEFREAGVLVADGAGNITSGEDDFAEITFSSVSHTALSGTYAIRNDGIGTAVLNLSNGQILTLAITMIDGTRAQITEYDSLATGAGSMVKQDTSVTALAPSGNFAFRLHNIGGLFASTSTSAVGLMNLASGVGSGSEDALRNGSVSTLALNAALSSPDSMGRGTGTITDTTTTNFVYYVVDANTIRILTSTPGLIGLGAAQVQSSGTFNDASLNGNYAFGLRADTNTLTEGSATVGTFAADGAGNITQGILDEVEDEVVTATGGSLTPGLYAIDSTGRGTMTLNSSLGTISEIFYVVGPGLAYMLTTNDSSRVEDGSFVTQQPITYSNSTLSGQYAFVTHGFTSSDLNDRVGTLIADGSGNITLTYLLNTLNGGPEIDPNTGRAVTLSFTGTYSVASNGRVTASIPSISNNFVFYLRSATDGDILQADSGVEITGSMSKQQ